MSPSGDGRPDDGEENRSREDTHEPPLTHDRWTRALRDGDLLGQRCRDCGHETAAPKAACARCGSRTLETVTLSTEGTVLTSTEIAVAPADFAGDAPYDVAVVDLGPARVLVRLEDAVEIGESVEFVGALEGEEPAPVFAEMDGE